MDNEDILEELILTLEFMCHELGEENKRFQKKFEKLHSKYLELKYKEGDD